MLKFEIISSRTVETDDGKKYVVYMLQVRQDITQQDPEPAHIERRYTDFLNLYNALTKDYGPLMNGISFPRKIMVGNFDASLISARCLAFENLLKHIAKESTLLESPAVVSFFRDQELREARKTLDVEFEYDKAFFILESSFKLLNKVYTDRSRIVLTALCRLVACATKSITSVGSRCLASQGEKWAQLALKRYEAVSDSDLLVLYIPLLFACLFIWTELERDTTKLKDELRDYKKRGMKVDVEEQTPNTFMEVLNNLDSTI